MEKIPTAREFYDKHDSDDCVVMMIDFAKMHVEAALKAASEKAKITYEYSGNTGSEYCDEFVDKDSILNSYPSENIK
jgi:hypothetical protein